MLHTLTNGEYMQLRLSRCMKGSAERASVAEILEAITGDWFCSFKGAKLSLLVFIVNRTFLNEKLAQQITISEFCNGINEVDAVPCGATGLSKSSVHTMLNELQSEDFISVFRTTLVGKDVETQPRIYEINCKKLLGKDFLTPTGNRTPPSKNWTPDNKISKISIEKKEDRTSSISSPTARRENRFSNQLHQTSSEGAVPMFVGKPKKEAAPRVVYSSASDAVASITQKHQVKRAEGFRAAVGKKASEITRPEMQAIFDTHTTNLQVGYRLMVTTREYGFLRKRLIDNGPADFSDFARWALTYWSTLATQNRNAVRRDKDRLTTQKALPASPHFNTIAYWYPYLFRAYQNNLAGRAFDAQVDSEKDQKIKVLSTQVARTAQDNEKLRQIIRRRPTAVLQPIARPPEEENQFDKNRFRPLARRMLPAAKTDHDLFEDMPLPTWDEVAAAKARQ